MATVSSCSDWSVAFLAITYTPESLNYWHFVNVLAVTQWLLLSLFGLVSLNPTCWFIKPHIQC